MTHKLDRSLKALLATDLRRFDGEGSQQGTRHETAEVSEERLLCEAKRIATKDRTRTSSIEIQRHTKIVRIRTSTSMFK